MMSLWETGILGKDLKSSKVTLLHPKLLIALESRENKVERYAIQRITEEMLNFLS